MSSTTSRSRFSQFSGESPQERKLSELIIEKPFTLDGTCPVENKTKHFPLIEKPQKKVKNRKVHCDKSDLKQKTTFPKLKSGKVTQQRIDAGEPCSNFLPKYYIQRLDSEHSSLGNIGTVAFDSEKCFDTSSVSQDSTKRYFNDGFTELKDALEVSSSEPEHEMSGVKEEKLEESKALKRWKFWMEDKRKQQTALSVKLRRNAGDLLMQEADKIREAAEDKLLLSYSKLPDPDYWRGCPSIWKPNICSKTRSKNQEEDYPNVCMYKTKLESGEKPELEFIGLPRVIKIEKGLLREPESKSGNFFERKRGRPFFNEEARRKCIAHEIQMDEMAIVGVGISEEQDDNKLSYRSDLPNIIVTDFDEGRPSCLDDRPSVFCLAINDKEIKYELETDCQDPKQKHVWELDFGVNAVGSITERKLKVENKGTMAVRYDWVSEKIERTLSLNLLEPKSHEPCFFFNKNSGIFLPGQIYDLTFYHHSKKSGIRKEIWHLKTEPPLTQKLDYGVIAFSAVTTKNILEDETDDLKPYLNKRLAHSIAKYIFDILVEKACRPSDDLWGVEYQSIFQEKELFEYQNPKYYYHSLIVKELKKIFDEIPFKTQTEWDLSMDSLVSLIKTYKADQEKNSTLQLIAEKAKLLLRPSLVAVKDIKKYKMSYEILCKMMNFMEEDYDYLRSIVSLKVKGFKPNREEADESNRGSEIWEEQMGELENEKQELFEIKPTNFVFFQTMFYLKVYNRFCEAVEHIAGVLETAKLFEPWKKVTYKSSKLPQPSK